MSHRHRITALGKLLTYILAHRPDEFGLVPDQEGFVPVKDLRQALIEPKPKVAPWPVTPWSEEGWSYVRRSHIAEVAYGSDRSKFELKDDRIRSTQPAAAYEAAVPPQTLYYGCRRRAYPHILQGGLDPGGRQFIPLATDPALALRIGRRRDPNPILVEIHAQRANNEGVAFYQTHPLLYLATHVPSNYIGGPPIAEIIPKKQQRPQKNHQKPPIIQELPGSALLNLQMQPLHREKKGKTWKDGARRDRRRQRRL
jgi:putative RNA 2'-phosphotransferase